MKISLGSRSSTLALWQTHRVADLLREAHPGLDVEIVTMETLGDRRQDVPMPKIGAKGLFTAELEEALAIDEIDIAVHSLKDLPSQLPEGLQFAGSPGRAAPTDAFLSTRHQSLTSLPEGARVATGSQRRRAQLLHLRPDLDLVDLRGNIGTRLKKLETEGHDGIIMATAALHRLELHHRITEELHPHTFVPAVGQGAIGLETRIGRDDISALLAPILHGPTNAAVRAERHFMAHLEGGCSVALGAHCHPNDDGTWTFAAWTGSQDGQRVLKALETGPDPAQLATHLTDRFLRDGARDILHS